MRDQATVEKSAPAKPAAPDISAAIKEAAQQAAPPAKAAEKKAPVAGAAVPEKKEPAEHAEGTLLSEATAQAADDKGGEKASPEAEAKKEPEKPKVPEKYELKLPEGSLLDAGLPEKIAAFSRERGFSNEQAQAVLEYHSQGVKEYVDVQVASFKATQDGWKKELAADPEVGKKLDENDELATRFVERFGRKGLLKDLRDSGFAYHPGLFKLLAAAGRAMADDKFVNPGRPGDGQMSEEQRLKRMFPSMAPKKGGAEA